MLSYIKQKEIAQCVKDLKLFLPKLKKFVIDACRKVGKPVSASDGSLTAAAQDTVELEEPDYELNDNHQETEEAMLQDEYDAERNNDDDDNDEIQI